MKRVLLFLVALPALLCLGVVGLGAWALWGRKLRVERGVLVFELKRMSWFYQTYYRGWGGTTLGYVIMTRPDPAEDLLDHELVHVEQVEAAGVWGLLVGGLLALLGHHWLGLTLWAIAPSLQYLGAGIAALLRGESFYRGNHLEEAAYASVLAAEQKKTCGKSDD